MTDLLAVLAVVFFWIVVACTVALLVRITAHSHDNEEVACELGDDYFARQPSEAVAHAS